MSNEIITKVLRIMELAMLINPTRTQKSTTGSKPTVMIDSYGHTNDFTVEIYPNGWDALSKEKTMYETYLNSHSVDESIIDAALTHLERIYKEIQEGKYND